MRVRLRHQRLADELARRPISLNRWAQILGLSRGHLSDLVNGKRPYPAPRTRKKLLGGLSLSFEELFEAQTGREGRASGNALSAQLEYRHTRPRWAEDSPPGPRPPGGRVRPPGERVRRRPAAAWVLPAQTFLGALVDDLCQAVRRLLRQPTFTLAAVAVLVIGIGSNSALFTFAYKLLWAPYPYEEPEKIVSLRAVYRGNTQNLSYPDLLDFADQSELVEVAISDWEPFALSTLEEPIRVGGGRVSWNLFKVLGVRPLLGRTFLPAEDRLGGDPVVLLGEKLWRRHFGEDPEILGRRLRINGEPRTVVGVMPRAAEFPDLASLWIPLAPVATPFGRDSHWLRAIGRLRGDADIEAAAVELSEIAKRLEKEYPESNEDFGIRVLPLREERIAEVRPIFLLLLGFVGFILLIVCANVANLMLARGAARGPELALRTALGADRSRLVAHLLSESFLLAALGLVGGWLFTVWALRGLTTLLPEGMPLWMQAEMDPVVLAYMGGLSVAAGLLSGLVPALQSSRTDLSGVFRDGSLQSARGASGNRLGAGLVVGEVALAMVLLVGSGLMLNSVRRMAAVDPGFEPRGVLVVGMDMLEHLDEEPAARLALFERYRSRLASLPGVEAVGAVDRMPLHPRTNYDSYRLPGQSEDEARANPPAIVKVVNSGYFAAMGIPIVRGETLSVTGRVLQEDGIVVSRLMAEALWPGREAVGERIEVDGDWLTVRGVSGQTRHRGLAREARPTFYVSQVRRPLGRMTWVLRSTGDPLSLVVGVRRAVLEIDPRQPIHDVGTLEEWVERSLWDWRLFSRLFSIFGSVALILAAVGLYGVMNYVVSQRTREVGVRLALGSTRGQVVRLVLAQGCRWVVLGALIGLPLALAVARILAGLLFGVSAFDPLTFGGVALVLGVVSVAAILRPALRASAVDPLRALRYH